jgi:hypothetical protein
MKRMARSAVPRFQVGGTGTDCFLHRWNRDGGAALLAAPVPLAGATNPKTEI